MNLDEQIFFFINHKCHVSLLNTVLPYWRSAFFWLPLYVGFIALMLQHFRRAGVFYLLIFALTMGISDNLSSQIIKKNVRRERPCQNERLAPQVKLLVRCGSGFSFPSSHATNHFAAATFCILTLGLRGRWRWGLWGWAASIAFAQVYVGVHFPSDVLVGALLGSGVAGLVFGVIGKFTRFSWEQFHFS